MIKIPGINNNIRNINIDLNINKITLNFFNKNIEAKFRQDYFKNSLIPFRISFITVSLLYAAFGYLDLITSEEFIKEFHIIRYLIVIPILSGVFLFSFHKYFRNIWQTLLSISFIAGGSGIIYMLLRNPNNLYYYGGMFLVIMAGYFFIHLRFLPATIAGIILTLIYSIAIFIFYDSTDTQFGHLLVAGAFFISAHVISMLALYNIEFLKRLDFNQRILLAEKQDEITKINQGLEEQVIDRTKLLDERNQNLIEEIKIRKKIEKSLIIAKEKAEESDRLKSSFLANMSHEIRTPMNGILGFADLLKEKDLTGEERDKYIEVIESSGERMLNIINDLLNVSTIEAGYVKVDLSEVNINEQMQDIFNLFLPEIESKGLKFIFKNKPKSDILIQTDKEKLYAIFNKLLKNAIKYTDEGFIEMGYEEFDNELKFFIIDSGIGIPKNQLKIIFDRFVQVDSSLSSLYEGAGLGLSITKSYVKMLKGKIWVHSEEGEGSEFYFSLPYKYTKHHKDKEDIAINKSAMNKLKQITLLIAEDQESSDAYLTAIVKDNCKKIYHVQTGVDAIKICQNEKLDLILMDIKMPIMNGYEATRAIREFNRDVIIIAQTAYAMPGDKEKALEAGCNDYISKPTKKDALLAIISKYFLN
ncbi:MAG: response regulator [Bacteroidetes bacterium]|nr:response regulator [Bacteroidota bacterium]